MMNFYGPAVNDGTINGLGGGVRFYSTLQNNGTVMGVTNSWIDGVANGRARRIGGQPPRPRSPTWPM